MSKPILALDQIKIASPCTATWEKMIGDERIRFCTLCERSVYNLSGLSRPEAENLILEQEGRLCVRFYRRADGTILTDHCPVGLQAVRRRLAKMMSALAVLLAGFAGALALLDNDGSKRDVFGRLRQVEPFATIIEWFDPSPPPVLMGRLACPIEDNSPVGKTADEP